MIRLALDVSRATIIRGFHLASGRSRLLLLVLLEPPKALQFPNQDLRVGIQLYPPPLPADHLEDYEECEEDDML
jgi:hypothetical protein